MYNELVESVLDKRVQTGKGFSTDNFKAEVVGYMNDGEITRSQASYLLALNAGEFKQN